MQLPQFLSLDAYLANETVYREQLVAGTYTDPIPLLNYAQLQELPDSTLVRFRGMIQDMVDPEIYLERYEVRTADGGAGLRVQDGRYRDVLVRKPNETVDFNNANNVNGERRSLFLVSIPGLNDWAARLERENSAVGTLFPRQQTTTARSGVAKRPLDDEHDANSPAVESSPKKSLATEQVDAAASASNNPKPTAAAASAPLSAQYLVNSPLPDRPGKACLAKVYADLDDFRLHTVVEVIGFLSVNPVLDASTYAADDDDAANELSAELQASNPPPSLVPRVHCIHVRPLQHLNPLLPDVSATGGGVLDGSAAETEIAATVAAVLSALTPCLFGDELAAKYLLCHLISTVYVRADVQAIGQFSLNLANIPASVLPWYTGELYAVLESLLPASHLLPLTLDNLNTLQFEPKKDYTTNKLTSSVLQLAPHTHLVLDETRLLAGRLQPSGVAAVQSIAHLITQQQLKADFQFYHLQYNTDVPVLCLSEGKSMLPSNSHVSLRPTDDAAVAQIRETLAAARHFLQPQLAAMRRLLTQLKLAAFDMTPECLETIQTDFVAMRRDDGAVSADDLHALLVLSRLLGLCQGGRSLTGEMWQQAKRMEAERRARLAPKSE